MIRRPILLAACSAVVAAAVAAPLAVASSGTPAAVPVPVAWFGAPPPGPVAGETLVPVLAAVPAGVSCSGPEMISSSTAGSRPSPVGATATTPSDYYAIELVPTGRVPGTRLSKGVAYTTAATSPFFGVALAADGEYLHDLDLRVEGLKPPTGGTYVAWVTDSDLAQVVRLGPLGDDLRITGQAKWNKFLVVLTLEPSDAPSDRWQGPVVMRGMSRSGRMHTMAGHGPFQLEPCLKYGFR